MYQLARKPLGAVRQRQQFRQVPLKIQLTKRFLSLLTYRTIPFGATVLSYSGNYCDLVIGTIRSGAISSFIAVGVQSKDLKVSTQVNFSTILEVNRVPTAPAVLILKVAMTMVRECDKVGG